MASNDGQNRSKMGAPDPPTADGGGDNGRSAGQLFGLGFQFCAAILLAVFAGQWVDRRYGTDPWGVMVGAFLGFGAGFFSIYRVVNKS